MIFLTQAWFSVNKALQFPSMGETFNPNIDWDIDDVEKPQDACGIVGVYAPGELVATIAYNAVHELQHRGQSGAGIYVNDLQDGPVGYKGNGLISAAIPDALSKMDILNRVGSSVSLGHTRYSTSPDPNAAQPYEGPQSGIAVAHNGHIEEIAMIATRYGIAPEAYVSDSQALTLLLDKRKTELGSIEVALKELLVQLDGGYCLTIMDGNRLIGVRDPWGFHPLALGELPDGKGYILASESTAFKDATYVRDIEPREIIIIDEDGIQSRHIERHETRSECAFEYIYFARPDSIINGISVYRARKNLGKYLARDNPWIEADVVVGVPSSGLAAAEGFAEESGIKSVIGLFKNPYISRSFIEPGAQREQIIRNKFHPNEAELKGKRVVLVDDSVIEGNTTRIVVGMLREAGAIRVDVLSSAPRYIGPCYSGMATGDKSKLIAGYMSNGEIAIYIGADSISFNPPERVEQATDEARINPHAIRQAGSLCMACATGEYPIQLSPTLRKYALGEAKH